VVDYVKQLLEANDLCGISWIPLRQISSDEVFESYLAVLLVCVHSSKKTIGRIYGNTDCKKCGLREIRRYGYTEVRESAQATHDRG